MMTSTAHEYPRSRKSSHKKGDLTTRLFFALVCAFCFCVTLIFGYELWHWAALILRGLGRATSVTLAIFGLLIYGGIFLGSSYGAVASWLVVYDLPKKAGWSEVFMVAGCVGIVIGVYQLVYSFPFRKCVLEGGEKVLERFMECWEVYGILGFPFDMTAAIIIVGWMPVVGSLLFLGALWFRKRDGVKNQACD